MGIFLVTVAVLMALQRVAPLVSMVGSGLIVLITLGSLSFLITTPKSWVPSLGDAQSSFPYLSGWGRLVITDLVFLGRAIMTMRQSARLYLNHRRTMTVTHPFPTPTT